jgi:hypothetical protein
MTGVMAGCAASALLVFMFGLRRTDAVGASVAVSLAE